MENKKNGLTLQISRRRGKNNRNNPLIKKIGLKTLINEDSEVMLRKKRKVHILSNNRSI